MKISIFGSTGKTGVEVVKQSLSKNYEVNAFVRDSSKLVIETPMLKRFIGDVLNEATFNEVNLSVEAIVITLSGIISTGIKNIINDAKSKGVKKIILLSSYPMSGSDEGNMYLKKTGMDEAKIAEMAPVINDKKEQEDLVMQSGLTWVIVRPTFLKDGTMTGIYEVYTDSVQFDPSKNSINRSDVADFILKSLETSEYDNKIASISS